MFPTLMSRSFQLELDVLYHRERAEQAEAVVQAGNPKVVTTHQKACAKRIMSMENQPTTVWTLSSAHGANS